MERSRGGWQLQARWGGYAPTLSHAETGGINVDFSCGPGLLCSPSIPLGTRKDNDLSLRTARQQAGAREDEREKQR